MDAEWAQILLRWFELMDRYEELGKLPDGADEVAYWNGERALVGLIASSVTSLGGAALVEYESADDCWKRRRPDLWFKLPCPSASSWTVEAKFGYLKDVGGVARKINEYLRGSPNADEIGLIPKLKGLSSEAGPDRLAALVFISPTHGWLVDFKGEFEERVSALLKGEIDDDAKLIAAALYERSRGPAIWDGVEHPGCMALVFEV